MTNHSKHINHIEHSSKNNNDQNASDIDTISNLLNNLSPKDLSILLSKYNIAAPKTINQNNVIQDAIPTNRPNQIKIENYSINNKILELLIAIRPLMSYERGLTLNKMIQICTIGNIFKK